MPPKKKSSVAKTVSPISKNKVDNVRKKSPKTKCKLKDENHTVQTLQTTSRTRKSRLQILSLETKIQLANEVVQSQFPKKYCFNNNSTDMKPIKKTTLKRRLDEKQAKNNDLDLSEENLPNSKQIDETLDTKKPQVKKRKIVKSSKRKIKKKPLNQGVKKVPKKTCPKICEDKMEATEAMDLSIVRSVYNDYVPENDTQISTQQRDQEVNTLLERVEPNKSHPINDTRRNSNFSWANDISDSSVTTCLTVKEDELVTDKIPILRLTRIDETGLYNELFQPKNAEDDSQKMDPNIYLPLSPISSTCKQKSPIRNCLTALKKLKFLENYDFNILSWKRPPPMLVGPKNELVYNEFHKKVVKENIFLEEERILNYDGLTNLLSKYKTAKEKEGKDSFSQKFKPGNLNMDNDVANNNTTNTNSETAIVNECKSTECETENDTKNRTDLDAENDEDDDALSLYAESITGIESSQRSSHNISVTNHVENNIKEPDPVTTRVFKIPKAPCNASKVKNKSLPSLVCEEQKPDSTSFQDFTNTDKTSTAQAMDSFVSKNPYLMKILFKATELVKSTIFKGVCVFNLVNTCKNSTFTCIFPHTSLPPSFINAKLLGLSNEDFIQEYMLVRNTPRLLQLYGLCFVQDCMRRNLSRILVEMSIDFIQNFETSATEKFLATQAVEQTLLHLNQIDLNMCNDLLRFEAQPGVLLCEKFLEAIGKSQNFSRFRTVFINLTMFMCRGNRTFKSNLTSQILERVCIFPYEFGLVRAIIEMMKRTDSLELSNANLGHFERQLSGANKELYSEFLRLKASLSPIVMESQEDNQDSLDKNIRYSPDTTNLDNSTKSLNIEVLRKEQANLLLPPQSLPGPSGLNTIWNSPVADFSPYKRPERIDSPIYYDSFFKRGLGNRGPRWRGSRYNTKFPRLRTNFPRRPGPGYSM